MTQSLLAAVKVCTLLGLIAAGALLSGPASFGRAAGTISFVRGTVAGSGFATDSPTSITFGPDGRLYVADLQGRIQALDLDPITKKVTAVEEVASNADLQDVIGIAFDPTDTSSPSPIYVTNTLTGRPLGAPPVPAGSYPGKITKIHGAGYGNKTDIITGLPAGQSHQSNGLVFADDGTLYIAQGGMTNAGVPGETFGRPEVPLSGAILVANLSAPGFDGNVTYDPPDTYDTSVDQISGDVSVYAHGFRNPYDLVIHSNGRIYATDNAPDSGFGAASTGCDSQVEDPWGIEGHPPDELNLINQGDYYGHPNRNRGRFDPRQCVYHPGTEGDGPDWTGPLALLPTSSNGLVEYTAGTFGGQLQGNLFYVSFVDGVVGRIVLSADGTAVTSHTELDSGYGNYNLLDITMGEDGTLYIAEFGTSTITFLQPDESAFIPGVLNTNAAVDGGDDVEPDVATDGAGNWLAVWDSDDDLGGTIGSDKDILVARSTDNGITWTPPVALNTNAATDVGDDHIVDVTTDGAGNWLAVWRSTDDLGNTIGVDSDILVARSTDNGATWTAPAALNTNAATDSGNDWSPRVTTDGAGTWMAVWDSKDDLGGTIGSDKDILVARSTDNGITWSAPVALNTNAATDAGDDREIQVGTDGAGTWVAVWNSSGDLGGTIGSDNDILVARSTDGGTTWSAPVALNTNAASDVGGDRRVALTTDGAGNWVAIWGSRDTTGFTSGANLDIRAARSTDNGATWTAETILYTRFTEAANDGLDHTHQQVTTDGLGNWLAIWESRDGWGADAVFDLQVALSTNNGATWTAPFVYIDTSLGGDEIHPHVTTDGAGNWLTVWGSPDNVDGIIGTDFDMLYRTDIFERTEILYLADTDGDGCTDQRENGPDETLGGLRNPKNPWDFYDVNGDSEITLFGDILGVILHFSLDGSPPYDVQFDRGPTTGPNPWNMTAPDGVINLFTDILGVIQQFGHDCR